MRLTYPKTAAHARVAVARTVSLEVAWSCKEEEQFSEVSREETLILKDGHESVCRNLAQIINNLPARQRELIQLRFYDGLGYDAIVEKTGLAHRTVYNKIHEALGRIGGLGLRCPERNGQSSGKCADKGGRQDGTAGQKGLAHR
jgi:DNA-directed RNA polymerase specialized sigma24 family protein